MEKSKPAKKGDVTFEHNLYDVLGHTLLEGIQQGRLDPRMVENMLSANLGVDLGGGYGANLGYNQYMQDRKQDLLLKITKDF